MVPNRGKNHGFMQDEWTTIDEFDPYLQELES